MSKMADNIKEPESTTEEEQKSAENTDSKSEESGVSGISFLIGLFIGLGFMAYAVISSRANLLETFSNADDTAYAYMSQNIEILLIMFKGVGAGCCGLGSCLFVDSFIGETQEHRTQGTMFFLTGLIMLALKTLVSTPIPPIQ